MSEARAPGPEQRRAPRYPAAPLRAVVSVVGAQLVNVSIYGALIESPVPMETGAVLPFRLVVNGQKVNIEARVVDCHAVAGERRRVYHTGIEWASIPAEIRQQLSEALRSGAAARPATEAQRPDSA